MKKNKIIGIVIFPNFEPLDVYGPVEMWGALPDYSIVFVAHKVGPVRSSMGVESIATYSFDNAPQFDILMVPGGSGIREVIKNSALINFVRKQDRNSYLTTSVCTGAAILAKAGLLDNRKATTNKLSYRWVTSQNRNVHWTGDARWVEDDKYITSSGVSAGTDMSLAVIEKIYGLEAANKRAEYTEYIWNDNSLNDPFRVD